MANDIPNATAASAIAMKPLEESAKKRAAEAKTAMRLEKWGMEVEIAQVADDSASAGKAVEDRDEGDGGPKGTQGGTHFPIPLLWSLH